MTDTNEQLRALLEEDGKIIPLPCGRCVIVDADWYEMLSLLRWHYHRDGYATRSYTQSGRTVHESMSRFIMDAPKGMLVDHINGNGLDNRRCNLRLTTRGGNNQNRSKTTKPTSSAYIGVHFERRGKRWISRIKHNGKRIELGSFTNELDAAIARDSAAIKLHGEFAKLNITPAEPAQEGAKL
jgi:hypothetical protein